MGGRIKRKLVLWAIVFAFLLYFSSFLLVYIGGSNLSISSIDVFVIGVIYLLAESLILLTLLVVMVINRAWILALAPLACCVLVLYSARWFNVVYLRGIENRILDDKFLETTEQWVFSQELQDYNTRVYRVNELPKFMTDRLVKNDYPIASLLVTGTNARQLAVGSIGLAFGKPPISRFTGAVLKVKEHCYLFLEHRP